MSDPGDLIEVRPNHRFDEPALAAYLREHLDGYCEPMTVRQFEGGQSNPTFLLTTPGGSYVLRKKPPGELLRSAHQVEREYRIYESLRGTDVPVPRTFLLCEDDSVIGTPFYVMELLDGRVFRSAALPGIDAAERAAIYAEMNRVLATLHGVDYQARGLGDYGKPGNYFVRQIGRWTKQFVAAKTHDIPSMDHLMEWLSANVLDDDTTTIVHGDYQLYNLMYHPVEPRVVAVLDWELSTLGHPMADLAYSCMKYHATRRGAGVTPGAGIPSEEEVLVDYCERSGRTRIENWNFYLAFSFFRQASIVQGVYKRGLQGNASSEQALGVKDAIAAASDKGWELARRSAG